MEHSEVSGAEDHLQNHEHCWCYNTHALIMFTLFSRDPGSTAIKILICSKILQRILNSHLKA